ncbi:MAG TPA: N-acetyl sugar amidotransferase [Gemmatimonadaceae bacterium]
MTNVLPPVVEHAPRTPPVAPGARAYRQCVRCVMDTTDAEIQFDAAGICNHCRAYDARAEHELVSEPRRADALAAIVDRIRKVGRGRDYDCIVGVSGGVDSTYTTYVASKLGLRPLAVHLDNGWNSEQAVRNIERSLAALQIDLYTHVLDWEEFRDLQVAFLRASTPDGEIPTDHAIAALLYRSAVHHGVRYIIDGRNLATEGILPPSWSRGHGDWKYIRSVQARFGSRRLRNFPHFGIGELAYYTLVRRLKTVSPLNYVPYVKADVMQLIRKELGWEYYGGKHYESVYTRFFQGYVLPVKFGIDKRKAHLSTLICSGQLTRERALEELAAPIYPAGLLEQDKRFVLKKLELSETAFAAIMAAAPRTFWDYPSYRRHPVFRSRRILTFYRRLKSS